MRYLALALIAAFATSDRAAAQTPRSDTADARRIFEANIDAIHKRDRTRYLSYYLQTNELARNGPGGLELGFANWSARRDSTWPDTLVARDLRLVSIAPGVVYGTYHYRVTQAGETSEGISERVFVKKPDGWKIGISTAFGLPNGAAPPPVVLVGGTLINPGKRRVVDAVVVVRAGKVVCAGASTECKPPAGVEKVDVGGTFITPGFIDAHVHYSQTGWVDGRPDAFDVRAQFPYDSVVAALQERPDRFNRAYLCSGVTSVFDVGGYSWTLGLAKTQERQLNAPRVAASGPLLATVDHWVNTATMRQFLHMKDDSAVRAAIRSLARLGSSAIKVWYLQLPDSAQPGARALLMAAGDEAKRVRLPLIVHATQLARAKEALQAGATVLVHSVAPDTVDAEFITLAKRNGTIVIPTLTVLEGYLDVAEGRSPASRYPLECVDSATRANLERIPSDNNRSARATRTRQREQSVREATVANIRRMREAGIPIAMGTDAGNPGTVHGPSVYREMEALQAAGMPAAEVLTSSTVIAARAMRRDDIGVLEPGKLADLVILEADPTTDIANARRIRMVMKGGALYGRKELLPDLNP